MENPFYIRPYQPTDLEAIAMIYNEGIIAKRTADTVPKTAADIARNLKDISSRETVLILCKGQSTIGWGRLKKYSDRPGYATTAEISVFITEKHCGKGLGSYFKQELHRDAIRLGYHHLVSKIMANNIASIRLNEKLGYEHVGRQREICFIDGVWHDVVIMQKIFGDADASSRKQ